MLARLFDPAVWGAVPFHFWSAIFFLFGCIVGSFLNVCIHRMPRGLSIVHPPSHCPKCEYAIPWYLNIPLVTWLYLGGKCKNCREPISPRYFLVELLTGLAFLACWLKAGPAVGLALIYSLFIAGLIVATFIDFEHYIIPDEITIGGTVVGFICSFLAPSLHNAASLSDAIGQSLFGAAVGAGIIYLILRLGKLFFGRHRRALPENARIIFTETALELPDESVPYGELLYRASDTVSLRASTLELVDRCYKDVLVRLTQTTLEIGEEKLNPEEVHHMEAVTGEIVLPREAMGLGDVKFMAAIGAFLGWKAVIFSLAISSVIGTLAHVAMVLAGRRAFSQRLPYGPYIAIAAALWVFTGPGLLAWYARLIHFGGPRP
jgi:leader peptidase (prepilin peptidase)/N-methyltransferase